MATCFNLWVWGWINLVPRPYPAFRWLQYGKTGRGPGVFASTSWAFVLLYTHRASNDLCPVLSWIAFSGTPVSYILVAEVAHMLWFVTAFTSLRTCEHWDSFVCNVQLFVRSTTVLWNKLRVHLFVWIGVSSYLWNLLDWSYFNTPTKAEHFSHQINTALIRTADLNLCRYNGIPLSPFARD